MTKFKRWFLGLFGGVPKSDYEEMKTRGDEYFERIQNFTEEKVRLEFSLEKEQRENELLKKQIAHDPMTPVVIKTQNVKLKEINKVASIAPLPLEQTEFCLRQAVLAEVAPFIKIEHKPSNQTATATLLIAEIEECNIRSVK